MDLITLIASSSLHLIVVNKQDKTPVGFGSGFLVRYKERTFLISVAHVTNYENTETWIETNMPATDQGTPFYHVGSMCFFDQYHVPADVRLDEIKAFEDLKLTYDKTLDITFCEIKENLYLIQPEWNFGAYQIAKGLKVALNIDEAGEPSKEKLFGFCGRIKQDTDEFNKTIQSEVTLKLDLKYHKTIGRFHRFLTPDIITSQQDYQGCSGAPILDEEGMLVGIVQSIYTNTKILMAFSIDECKKLLDTGIITGMLD